MTRTATYKALYFAALAGCAFLIVGAVYAVGDRHHVPAVAALTVLALLVIPGRIQAHFWSDLLAGLHHLNQRNYALSKTYSERFLAQLQAKPWLKRLIWLGTSAYSRDADALARNNLGAAMWKLGELEAAQEQLMRAIALDPKCPLPYHNMGVLLLNSMTSVVAMPWLEKAEALGFKDNWSDDLAMVSQRRHAASAVGGSSDIIPPASPQPLPPVAGAFVLELINDDRTKMEFVVTALEGLFGLTGAEAIKVMLAVHRNGSAACAGFDTEAAAQAKADELIALARASDFPLSCRVVTQ